MASNYWIEEDDLGINDLFSETRTSFSERTETNHPTVASMDSTNTSKTIEKQTNSETTNDDSEEEVPFENYSAWIRSKIKMRRCIHFVSRTEDPAICHCGHEQKYHMEPNKSESNPDKIRKAHSKYVFLRDTRSGKTNAFGEIKFVGCGGDIKPKFVRVDNNIDMSVIIKLIKRWGLEYPNLLISVSGDTNEFLKRSTFRDGIMKAARDTGAWFITDGTDSSGMNQDLLEPAKILEEHVLIGIAPWGVIRNRDDLVNKKGSWPAKYGTTGTCNSNERFLNPNHSHYILVDDGTQHKLDIEIPFRLKLEHEIDKMKTKTGNDVLIVSLVMGGGEGTLQKVNQTLKHDTPVVVVKGSGGAADILAFAFENASTCDEHANSDHGQDSNRNEIFMPEGLEDKIRRKMTQTNISRILKVIQSCLRKSDLIHIVDLNRDGCDIRAVLLKALMKAYVQKMNISIAMLIFSEDVDESITHVLQHGRTEIVKQLINQNRQAFTKFSTSPKKLKLYNNVVFKRIFNDIRLQNKDKEEIKLNDVRYLVQDLVDIDLLQHYKDDTNGKEDQNKPDNTPQGMTPFDNKEGNEEQDNQESDSLQMDPCMDLLIWSVLNNRQDIAKEFWRHGKVKMVTALVAHALLSAMSREIDDRDLLEAIDNSSSEFMTLAINTAKACSKANEEDAFKLLKAKSPRWGNTTCIEIALNSRNKEFLSLKVCRDLIHKIWMGGLKPKNSIMALLLCIAFPPFIIWLARFEKTDDIQETLCCFPSKRSNGHHYDQVVSNKSEVRFLRSSVEKPNGNSREESTCMKACSKLRTFYSAPIIVFMHNIIFFVAFLVLYSYVLVSKLEPKVSVENVCLILWVLSFFIGEIIQFKRLPALSFWKKWKLYKADGWNVLDMLTISLFIIGMSLLMINPHPISAEIARVILGIDLVLFFLRLLHACHAHREVGPKLVMIMKMVWDLASLAAILGVFILAYAVASYAILYPNTALDIHTLMKILKRPFWNIYGELLLDEIEGEDNCPDNETLYGNKDVQSCPTMSGQYVVPVMMGIYMMMTNILLISLLSALFSYSIEKVHKQTDLHYNYHRCNLIYEYAAKPWLPHPFAILSYLIMIMSRICKKLSTKKGNAFEQTFDENVEKELCEFERVQGQIVYRRMEEKRAKSININGKSIPKTFETKVKYKINTLTAKVEQIDQKIVKDAADMSNQLKAIMDSLKELKEQKLETKLTCNEDTDEK